MKRITPEEILNKHCKQIFESDGVRLTINIVEAMKEYCKVYTASDYFIADITYKELKHILEK